MPTRPVDVLVTARKALVTRNMGAGLSFLFSSHVSLPTACEEPVGDDLAVIHVPSACTLDLPARATAWRSDGQWSMWPGSEEGEKFQQCSRCCQKQHWKSGHKRTCQAPNEREKAVKKPAAKAAAGNLVLRAVDTSTKRPPKASSSSAAGHDGTAVPSENPRQGKSSSPRLDADGNEISFGEDEDCAICLETLNRPARLPCGHWYCKSCSVRPVWALAPLAVTPCLRKQHSSSMKPTTDAFVLVGKFGKAGGGPTCLPIYELRWIPFAQSSRKLLGKASRPLRFPWV